MLVLFNTGYRVGYIGNVIRTLFLPLGADNEYRYRIGDDGQVARGELASLAAQKGEKALICFGDRYASIDGKPSYVFYPLRVGEVVDVTTSGGRVFVRVRLGEFVHARDADRFTHSAYAVAEEKGFKLLAYSEHPENGNDGRYAFALPGDCLMRDLVIGDKSWLSTVQQLERVKAFSENLSAEVIFSKATIESRKQPVPYKTIKKAQMASLEKDDDLRLVVHYYFPSQDADRTARAVMKIAAPNGAQILTSAMHELGMKESRVEIPVVFEPASDKRFFSFDVSFDSVTGGPEILGAAESLLLRAKTSYWRQLLLALSVILYVVGSVVLVKEDPLGGALIQGISLIGMLQLVGKKVV